MNIMESKPSDLALESKPSDLALESKPSDLALESKPSDLAHYTNYAKQCQTGFATPF